MVIWVSQRFGNKKIGFNSCECIKFLNIVNFHVWGKCILICNDTAFFLHFFPFFDFAMQLFFTPVTSSNLCNQAPLFTELRLSQATYQRWSDSDFLLSDPILFLKNDIHIRSESCSGWNHTIRIRKLLKVYYDAQHTFLCFVYFASWGKITSGVILPSAEHDWLK